MKKRKKSVGRVPRKKAVKPKSKPTGQTRARSKSKPNSKTKKALAATGNKLLRVAELFAGVGGFRVGLERASEDNDTTFKVVWSNQWEPGTNTQTASDIYVKQFKVSEDEHFNDDIAKAIANKTGRWEATISKGLYIPDHDVLVGGFPCQDYSVARTLNQAAGIDGKKGVLWWQIHRILKEKKVKPKYLILENVDRLLKSPAVRRGRDFAIMLASLAGEGYAVEWRVINAADYGFPQRRRRIFFVGYHKKTPEFKQIARLKEPGQRNWLLSSGLFAKAFPAEAKHHELGLAPVAMIKGESLAEVTSNFNLKAPHISPFHNAGLMLPRTGKDVPEVRCRYWTLAIRPTYPGPFETLGEKLVDDSEVPDPFYVNEADLPQWKYLKGAKSAVRKSKKTGHEYSYDEGSMVFPDPLDRPSRTIITGEGGSTPSRFKHVVQTASGRLRRLVPKELERLNMFDDDHTAIGKTLGEISPIKRAFLMGNALVVGIIEKIGKELIRTVQAHGK